MARFYALFALAASACVMQTGATPVVRDDGGLGGIIQQVECSAITNEILTGLETASGFLGLIPGASAISNILNDAISIGKDLTAQCASQSSSSSSSALVSSRDLLSGIESIIGSFECSPITQDIMGAVETGLSLISGSSNADVQKLVSVIQEAITLFKSMSASCSNSKRQLNIGGIIDSVVCNSVVEDIMNTLNTALPVISSLDISAIQSFVNALQTVSQIYQSLETSCSSNSNSGRSLATRDFWGSLGSIFQNAECSTTVGVIMGGLQTLTSLLAADTNPVVQELVGAVQTAVSLGEAATASCKSS